MQYKKTWDISERTFKVSIYGKVLIMIDNQGAMSLAKNPVNHHRSKHIDIKYHFIRSEAHEGWINLQHIPSDWSEESAADILQTSQKD